MIPTTYSHTQRLPYCLILFGSSIPFFVLAWLAREQPVRPCSDDRFRTSPGTSRAGLPSPDGRRRGRSTGDPLRPLPFLETSVRYADISGSRSGARRSWMAGESIGTHGTAGSGTSGAADCVVIHRRRGVLRVGSDDAENLAEFLKGKMGAL